MKLSEPFIINGEQFTLNELLDYSKSFIEGSEFENWETELYHFILTFLDEKKRLSQYSSGTTGDPKEFKLDRESMFHSAKNTIKYFDLKPGDRVLLSLPIRYIAGKMMVVRALLGGMNLLTLEPSGNPFNGEIGKVDFGAVVPLQIYNALKEGYDLSGFSKLLVGGAEISENLRKEIGALKTPLVYETFGMSESYTHIAVKCMNGDAAEEVFRVLPDVMIGIDGRGCLTIDAQGITAGEITTNDLVELVGGDGFRWLGRIDNVINSGGVKIMPELLERQIKDIVPYELLLIALPDDKLGQQVVLLVEGLHSTLSISKWNDKLVESLEKFHLPKEIICIPKIPRNASMKLDRSAAMRLVRQVK